MDSFHDLTYPSVPDFSPHSEPDSASDAARLRIARAHYRLTSCLLERAPLEAILAAAEEVLGNPLFLSDTSTRVLKFSSLEKLREVDDELIQCVIRHGFVLSDYFEKYDYASLLPLIEKNEKAFLQTSSYETKKERLIVKLTVNRRYFGWIVAFPCNQPFREGDCQIMDILATVLSLELERNKIGFALSCRENLLMELLSGGIRSIEEFKNRAQGFDWRPGEDFYAMAITFRHDKKYPDKERTITAYKNHLGLIYPTYKSICLGNTLLLLLETADIRSVIRNLDSFFKSNQLAAGCSRHFSSVLEFKTYVDQAMEILRLGLSLKPGNHVYLYEDFYLHYAASLLARQDSLQYYCLPQLRMLLASDRENHTCYAETLRAYVKRRGAIPAAEELHIHRNTMNYRLQKITEITGLNLNEGDDLYKLWFSFLLLDMEPGLAGGQDPSVGGRDNGYHV